MKINRENLLNFLLANDIAMLYHDKTNENIKLSYIIYLTSGVESFFEIDEASKKLIKSINREQLINDIKKIIYVYTSMRGYINGHIAWENLSINQVFDELLNDIIVTDNKFEDEIKVFTHILKKHMNNKIFTSNIDDDKKHTILEDTIINSHDSIKKINEDFSLKLSEKY